MIELKNTKSKVEFCLRQFPKLRDSDMALICHVWRSEIDYHSMSGEDVLRAIANEKLTNPESIRRVRQRLTEYHPELRGASWRKRHEKETVIKNELKNL